MENLKIKSFIENLRNNGVNFKEALINLEGNLVTLSECEILVKNATEICKQKNIRILNLITAEQLGLITTQERLNLTKE